MSFERFPYTNFHELNLDWVVKHAQEALDRANEALEKIEERVKSVNNVTPDASGNVTVNDADIPYTGQALSSQDVQAALDELAQDVRTVDESAVKKVNGKSPDQTGAVTVLSGDIQYQYPDKFSGSDVEEALDALFDREPGDVSSVNGVGADSSGNVTLGAQNVPLQNEDFESSSVDGALSELMDIVDDLTDDMVKSVNGETPDSSGAVTINASAIQYQGSLVSQTVGDALDEVAADVEAVEGDMVKSVNGLLPDSDGEIEVGASDVGYSNTEYPLLTDVDKVLAALLPLKVTVEQSGGEWVADATYATIRHALDRGRPVEVYLNTMGSEMYRLPFAWYSLAGASHPFVGFSLYFNTSNVSYDHCTYYVQIDQDDTVTVAVLET